MTEAIVGFFSRITANPYLLSAILSVVPVTEIKGSILFAAAADADPLFAALFAYLSSLALCFVLTFTVPKALRTIERFPRVKKATSFLTDRMTKKADKLLESAGASEEERRKNTLIFGVYAFVALPLPMTGVWTGAMLSALLRLDRKSTFFALATGNLTAGGAVLAISLLAGEKASAVLDLFLLLSLALVLFAIFKGLWKRRKVKAE